MAGADTQWSASGLARSRAPASCRGRGAHKLQRSAAPGGDLDLVTVRIVEIQRLHGHEGMCAAANLEAECLQALAFGLVVSRVDLEADVVESLVFRKLLAGRRWDEDDLH